MFAYRVRYDAVITRLAENNPKRPGSQAHRRFECYRTGMTVLDFLDAGGRVGDIYNDISRCYSAVSDFPYREIADQISGDG